MDENNLNFEKKSSEPSHMATLNERQKEAVRKTEGALLILAGAGAGKTKTVTHRILHLIKEGKNPESILAITFTNKAAKEMKERVMALLLKEQGDLSGGVPFISTFHSLGVRILREHGKILGLPKMFSIYDRQDSKQAIKDAMEAKGVDPKQYEPAKILSAISREKGAGVFWSEFETGEKNYFGEIVSDVWEAYEAILEKDKALDFDDLLLKTLKLLRNPEVQAYYNNLFSYIHIDEYQDTNKVQYEIAKMLAKKSGNIAVVGDIDQSIYSWRGADFKNIMRFEKDYEDAHVVLLEENYRSTQNILAVANEIIRKNTLRKEKNLFTKNVEGDLLSLYIAFDERDEAGFIARTSKMLIEQGVDASEIAVLYRANFQSRIIEESFLKSETPYDLIGTKFFERKEVKDAICYLKSALNNESICDFKRIINTPARGIGKVSILKILSDKEAELDKKAREKLNSLRVVLNEIKDKAFKEKPSETVKFVIRVSGLEEMYKNGKEEDLERLENLRELVTIASGYDALTPEEGIMKFLEHVALSSDQDELDVKKTGVKLMTVHAAKGLEFDYVFITGLEQELFPHKRLNEDDQSLEQAEEERRLFYVAVTRARKKVYLTYAQTRTIFGSKQITMPSEFLGDIGDEFLMKENSGFEKLMKYIDW